MGFEREGRRSRKGPEGSASAPRALRLAGVTLAFSAILVSFSCTPVGFRSRGWASPPRIEAPAYYAELDRTTWYESLYVGLDLRAFLAITWLSPALQLEQAGAIAQMRGLSQEEKDELLACSEEEQGLYLDFLLSLYTARRAWNDLAAKDSIWRVELLAPGGAVFLPLSIERVFQPDANLIALYPFISRFATTYKIRFAATDEEGEALLPAGTERLRLRLISAVARSEPHWRLKEEGRVGTAANGD